MTAAFVGQFHFLLVKALVTFDCCNLMPLTEKGERAPVGTVRNVTFKAELKKPTEAIEKCLQVQLTLTHK